MFLHESTSWWCMISRPDLPWVSFSLISTLCYRSTELELASSCVSAYEVRDMESVGRDVSSHGECVGVDGRGIIEIVVLSFELTIVNGVVSEKGGVKVISSGDDSSAVVDA